MIYEPHGQILDSIPIIYSPTTGSASEDVSTIKKSWLGSQLYSFPVCFNAETGLPVSLDGAL